MVQNHTSKYRSIIPADGFVCVGCLTPKQLALGNTNAAKQSNRILRNTSDVIHGLTDNNKKGIIIAPREELR